MVELDKIIGEDGSKSQRVDIHYKFIGYIPMDEWVAETGAINGYTIAELMEESA